MSITPLRRTATATLLFLSSLPGFARDATPVQPVAVQMYTLRHVASLDEQLKIVHDAGVRAVETVGTQNVSASELKRLLDTYSIRVISSHVQLADLRADLDGVVAFQLSVSHFAVGPQPLNMWRYLPNGFAALRSWKPVMSL